MWKFVFPQINVIDPIFTISDDLDNMFETWCEDDILTQVEVVADNDYDGWTTDNLTEEIFDIALGLDVTNLLNMTSPASTINDIITWPAFASRFDDWRTYDPFQENVTTYTEHFLTALGAGYASNMLNNPDYQNFTIASWNACQQSNDRIKAPSRPQGWNVRGFCEITASEWASLSGLASTSSDNLTTSTLQDIISLTSATNANNAFVNLASLTDFEADYIRNCVGTSVSSSSISGCVTNATSALVNTQKVSGMIAGIIFTLSYIIYFQFLGGSPDQYLFGISPEGIGFVGMLINFVVTGIVTVFTPPPPRVEPRRRDGR